MRTRHKWVIALALMWSIFPVLGQYDGSAAARAAFDEGEKARKNSRYAEASDYYQKAISLDPNFAQAYEQYKFVIYQVKPAQKTSESPQAAKSEANQITQGLIQKYEDLSHQNPNKAIYRWALAQLYSESDPLRQEALCKQAVDLEASFAPGYECLARVADLRGDDKDEVAFRRKAMELQPDSADEAFYYFFALQNDPEAYRRTLMDLIQKFPDSPRAAQALYWYAENQKTDAAKIEAFESLYKKYPPAKFNWSGDGMEALLALLDRTDPHKAKTLARELVDADPKEKEWTTYAAYEEGMTKAEQAADDHDLSGAMAALRRVKAPGYGFDERRRELLFAHVLDLQGKTADAYDGLLASYAEHPTIDIRDALMGYGAKLGKNSGEIEATIWSTIKTNSTPAIPFSFPKFSDGKQLSLSDYLGHVVIVEFWFPNCGPCRGAFLHLQNIAKKYNANGLVVVAINAMEGQEAFVEPLLKSKGYDFVPLKGNEDWAERVYHVRAFPSTFLIGKDGRVYFRPHLSDDLEERTTDLEIEELLRNGVQ
jgi:thiol-disulfide isomerase/thioredoxin